MTWATSPPTEPGYWWARWRSHAANPRVEIVRVDRLADDLLMAFACGLEEQCRLYEFTHWAGPLVPPEDP